MVKLANSVEFPAGYASHSKTVKSAAIANHSVRALVNTAVPIEGKPGAMMTLVAVMIVLRSTLTTVVQTGGLFEFENDSVDWKPFEVYPHTSTAVGANAGAPMSPCIIPVNKPLPAGSNVSVYYTAINAATDSAEVTLFWSTKPFSGKATYIKSGKGAAITQVTIAAAHVSVAIPAQKGGSGIGILAQVYGTIETIVVSGGLVAVRNASCEPSIEPLDWFTGGVTSIGTGGAEQLLQRLPYNFDCPGNSTFLFDFTPTDNQSQYLAVMVVWEK